MQDNGDQLSVATAGLNSGGHNAIEAIKAVAGGSYKHVTYDGGNPAVIATVSGETQATTQLAVEQAETWVTEGRLDSIEQVFDLKVMEIINAQQDADEDLNEVLANRDPYIERAKRVRHFPHAID